MILLSGKNLGERHRELNTKVKEAAAQNVDFEQIKHAPEKTDIDKIFKIELASKYINIEYIIEVLKSGDSLYISRGLKCKWLYDDEFSTVINPDYLHNNVFPTMSAKMKNKLLVAIATHVRKQERAMAFYKYCSNAKMTNIALKFLIFTSDEFKLQLLKEDTNSAYMIYNAEGYYCKYFIGTSFTILEAFVSQLYASGRLDVFIQLSYLYSVSDTRFLELLESLEVTGSKRFGVRISKSILTKHKKRVLNKPQVYADILDKNTLIKHSKSADAKLYLESLLPSTPSLFWSKKFCSAYKHLIKIIPETEIFVYIKKIFDAKYPGTEFEMSVDFFQQRCYEFMTAEEKETWALGHIASHTEIRGVGNDYEWYKFVSYDKAFEEIKKLIVVTSDKDKRSNMLDVLIESATTQCDLEKLFTYYYVRHVNEKRYKKDIFVNKVLRHHKFYEFDQECWMAFNKILHSMDVYSMQDNEANGNYKITVLIYSIIHNKEVHEAVKLYINTNIYLYSLKLETRELPKEQEEIVYQYLFKYYVDKVSEYDNKPYGDNIKHQVKKYVNFFLDLLQQYDKPEQDIPEIVTKFMKLDWGEYNCHSVLRKTQVLKKTTEDDLFRYIKKDVKLVVDSIPTVYENIENEYKFHISKLLKKIKIYFPGDVSKTYLDFFVKLLESEELYYITAKAAVHGIFQLADGDIKNEIMIKYAPIVSKINHSEIKEELLHIQRAICGHALYSRPPVPLKNILLYIKGDYVHYCMPLFNSYLANLPLPLCMEFIEAILDTPVSIQKHGLRLAFACFSAENLKNTVMNIWKRTNNVSLRAIMYKAIFDKVYEKSSGNKLYETLISLTLDIHQDDDASIFSLLTSKLPDDLLPEYIKAGWTVISKLSLKPSNIQHVQNMIKHIHHNIELVDKELLKNIVEEFIKGLSSETGQVDETNLKNVTVSLYESKWYLAAKYITYIESKDDIPNKLKLVNDVFECIKILGDKMKDNKQFIRHFSIKFVDTLEQVSFEHRTEHYENMNGLFEGVLNLLQEKLSLEEIYVLIWYLRLGLITRKAIFKLNKRNKMITNQSPGLDKKIMVRDMCIDFGHDLGILTKNFVEKEAYYPSFYDVIQQKIKTKISNLLFDGACNDESNDFAIEDLEVTVAYGLIKCKMNETYLIALELIPSNYSGVYIVDYAIIWKELRKVDNKEIRCNFNHKFVNVDTNDNWFMESLL